MQAGRCPVVAEQLDRETGKVRSLGEEEVLVRNGRVVC